ncbi:MAG TPA: 50S ribosomal protein L34 [Planctomycetota bacterium]|nr:50S ribosomal protein L34 [Planctomycetota bacterium]
MKVNIRRSKAKWLKSVGFLTRMKTKGGRKIIKRHRRLGRRLTPKQP